MVDLSKDNIAELTDTFRLLGEPNRLRLVLACLDRGRSVGELSEELAMSQTSTSHHLRLLRFGRMLKAEKDGRHVLYAIDDMHVREVLQNMIAHLTEPHEHRRPVEPPIDDDGRI